MSELQAPLTTTREGPSLLCAACALRCHGKHHAAQQERERGPLECRTGVDHGSPKHVNWLGLWLDKRVEEEWDSMRVWERQGADGATWGRENLFYCVCMRFPLIGWCTGAIEQNICSSHVEMTVRSSTEAALVCISWWVYGRGTVDVACMIVW